LAYNLIRRVMVLAAIDQDVPAWQISFKGTVQTLNNFLPIPASCMPLDAGCAALLKSVAAHTVGNRTDRYEPRRLKRRPKPHQLMQMPREEYKRRMR
jgi:hypothetical protein